MEEEILKKLDTKFLGKQLIILEEIDSTQSYIKERADELPNGLVVIAKNQTAGKGTNGRVWYTESDKNLTFSFILKPNCDIKKIEHLTVLIAEMIVATIKEMYGYDLKIKHPNDIILNNKKMGGILTESVINKDKVKQIVVGIGLDINQEKFDKELEWIATSLKKEYGKEFCKVDILANFLNKFEENYILTIK